MDTVTSTDPGHFDRDTDGTWVYTDDSVSRIVKRNGSVRFAKQHFDANADHNGDTHDDADRYGNLDYAAATDGAPKDGREAGPIDEHSIT